MKQRIKKRDEPLPELAQDIKRLTRMAYRSAVLDLRDCLSKDSFIEALNDAEMELFICQKEPERLEDCSAHSSEIWSLYARQAQKAYVREDRH